MRRLLAELPLFVCAVPIAPSALEREQHYSAIQRGADAIVDLGGQARMQRDEPAHVRENTGPNAKALQRRGMSTV